MAFSNIDRTSEVKKTDQEIIIHSTDYCCYFEKHLYTLLQRKECWACKYGDFGIEAGNVSETGICQYHLIH